MKKFLPLFAKALTLVLFTTFISCSDDDKDENNNNSTDKIVGSWVYNGYTDPDGVFVQDDTDPCVSFTMTFNSNGTGTEVDKDCINGDDTWNTTWKAKGNNVYEITGEDEGDTPELITVAFLSDNKINVMYEDEGVTYTETFTKK
jgi:hypothetical protein